MGIGPSPAIQQLLKESGKTLNDIDLVEVRHIFSFTRLIGGEKVIVECNLFSFLR